MGKGEEIVGAFWELFNKKIWLDENKMKELLKGYMPSEIHCIDYIGKHEDVNVTMLADTFYMTRSAISKLTKRLIEKGILVSYKKPDNKKDVCFKLTQQGEVIYNIHEKFHQEIQARDRKVLEQVTEEQYQVMMAFIQNYTKHLEQEIIEMIGDTKAKNLDKF